MASSEQKISNSKLESSDDCNDKTKESFEEKKDETIIFGSKETFGKNVKWTHESIRKANSFNQKLAIPHNDLKNWKFVNLNNQNTKTLTSDREKCHYCQSVVSSGNMKDHLENICLKAPIKCPLCGIILKNGKNELSSHWDNDCIKYHRFTEYNSKKKEYVSIACDKNKYYQRWFDGGYPLYGRETRSEFCSEYDVKYNPKYIQDYCRPSYRLKTNETDDNDNKDNNNTNNNSSQVEIKLYKCDVCQSRTFFKDDYWCPCDDYKEKQLRRQSWQLQSEHNEWDKNKMYWTDTSGMDLLKVEQFINENKFLKSEWNHLEFNQSYPFYGNETKYKYCFENDYINNKKYIKNYCRKNVQIEWKLCDKCAKRMDINDDKCICQMNIKLNPTDDYFYPHCVMIATLPFLLGIRVINNLIRSSDDSMHVPKEIIMLMNKYYSGVSYYDNNNNELLPYLRNRQTKQNLNSKVVLPFVLSKMQVGRVGKCIEDRMCLYGNMKCDYKSNCLRLTLRDDCRNMNGITAFVVQELEYELGDTLLTFDELSDLMAMLETMSIVHDNNMHQIFDCMMKTVKSRNRMNMHGEDRSDKNGQMVLMPLEQRRVYCECEKLKWISDAWWWDHGNRGSLDLSSIVDIIKGDKNTILNMSNVNHDYKGRNWFEIISPKYLLTFECHDEKECDKWICYLKILSKHYKQIQAQIEKYQSSLNYLNTCLFPQ